MQDIDRRTTLGLLASTGLSALAGCAVLGGSASVSYADWMPERSEPYNVVQADVETFLDADVSNDAEDRLGEVFFAVPDDVIDIDDVGSFASANRGDTVCTYTIDREELVADLEDTSVEDMEAPDPPDGYDAFATPQMLYWLDDDYLIGAPEADGLEALYDTNQGDEDAYADDETVSALDDQLDADDVVVFAPGETATVADGTGLAYGWSVDDDTANVEMVVAFADADDAEDADLSTLAESDLFGDYDDVESNVEDRFGVVTGSITLDDFDLLASDSSSEPTAPQVTFSFEYDDGGDGEWNGDDDERVVIQHDGGETVDVSTVSIRVAGTPVGESAGIESDKPETGQMSAGDQWTLQATGTDSAFESGTDIVLVWESPDGGTVQILAESTMP